MGCRATNRVGAGGRAVPEDRPSGRVSDGTAILSAEVLAFCRRDYRSNSELWVPDPKCVSRDFRSGRQPAPDCHSAPDVCWIFSIEVRHPKNLELEPFSGRERSGNPLAKSRAQRGTSPARAKATANLVGTAGLELEPFSGRERSGSPLVKSRAQRGTSPARAKATANMVGTAGLELEPFSGRERSGNPLAKSRAQRGTSPARAKATANLVGTAGLEPATSCV